MKHVFYMGISPFLFVTLILGGMEDYNYLHSNCLEITIELSCCKYPPRTQLPEEWENNKEALLAYLEMVGGALIIQLYEYCCNLYQTDTNTIFYTHSNF